MLTKGGLLVAHFGRVVAVGDAIPNEEEAEFFLAEEEEAVEAEEDPVAASSSASALDLEDAMEVEEEEEEAEVTPPPLPAEYLFRPGSYKVLSTGWIGCRKAAGIAEAKSLIARQVRRGYRSL